MQPWCITEALFTLCNHYEVGLPTHTKFHRRHNYVSFIVACWPEYMITKKPLHHSQSKMEWKWAVFWATPYSAVRFPIILLQNRFRNSDVDIGIRCKYDRSLFNITSLGRSKPTARFHSYHQRLPVCWLCDLNDAPEVNMQHSADKYPGACTNCWLTISTKKWCTNSLHRTLHLTQHLLQWTQTTHWTSSHNDSTLPPTVAIDDEVNIRPVTLVSMCCLRQTDRCVEHVLPSADSQNV